MKKRSGRYKKIQIKLYVCKYSISTEIHISLSILDETKGNSREQSPEDEMSITKRNEKENQ